MKSNRLFVNFRLKESESLALQAHPALMVLQALLAYLVSRESAVSGVTKVCLANQGTWGLLEKLDLR